MQTARETIFSIRDLSIRFTIESECVHALDKINLDVSRNEILCILGPSGCGKSTLLRIAGGFETRYFGAVTFKGSAVRGCSTDRGFIFQEARLFPWMTVEKNVEFGLNDQFDKAERRAFARHALTLVGLERFSAAFPHQLSGGMQQRVSIARALVNKPSLLLLDEPFGALDAFTRIHMQNELLKIRDREKMTMILVTHDIDEAVTLADRVALMSPRPGSIKRIVEVPIARPRQHDDPDYTYIRNKIYAEFFSGAKRQPEYSI
jgi:sulfonate transport system ATP-binding protein